MDRHILLTGGTGYLGSNLLKDLLLKGYSVIVLKRSGSSLSRLVDLDLSIKIISIDEVSLDEIFKENTIDGVIHTAANYGRKGESINDVIAANLDFSLKLLTKAIEYKLKFFINTDTSLPANLNAYSLSKSHFVDWLKFLSKEIKVINIIPNILWG